MAAAACLPAGVVFAFAEPSNWRTAAFAGWCWGRFTVFAAHSPLHYKVAAKQSSDRVTVLRPDGDAGRHSRPPHPPQGAGRPVPHHTTLDAPAPLSLLRVPKVTTPLSVLHRPRQFSLSSLHRPRTCTPSFRPTPSGPRPCACAQAGGRRVRRTSSSPGMYQKRGGRGSGTQK